jgi:hypothetical protein
VNALNHCCKNNIQNKKIATQADISLKFGLIQNQNANMKSILGRKIFLKRSDMLYCK